MDGEDLCYNICHRSMVLFTCKKASKTNSIGNLARLCLLPVCFLFLFIYLFIFYHHAADGLSCADVAFQAFESSVCNWSICNPNISLLLTQGYY